MTGGLARASKDIIMPPLPTPEAWLEIRHDYENTRRSIEDICIAHGISATTLRRRVKEWGWTMRHPPLSDQEPPAYRAPAQAPGLWHEGAPSPTLPRESEGGSRAEPSPHITEPTDPRPASERLRDAAARVMRAIETTSARLAAGPVALRETELAARTLVSLMRTWRELNAVLGQQAVIAERDSDPVPEDMDEFRNELARRLEAVLARHEAEISTKYEATWHDFAAEAAR